VLGHFNPILHVLRIYFIFPGPRTWEIQMLMTEQNFEFLIDLTNLNIGNLLIQHKNIK
jgi:hypothetical protein